MRLVPKILAFCYTFLLCGNILFANTDSTDVETRPVSSSITGLYTDGTQLASVALSSEATFSFPKIKSEFPVPEIVLNDRNEAEGIMNKIDELGAWINTLTQGALVTLPVGMKQVVNEVVYEVGIAKASIHRDYTELTVFARIRMPQSDENGNPIEAFFGANNVKLSHQGGIVGDANLVLLGDVQIPFNAGNWLLELKGGFDYKTGGTQNLTYVSIDCNGVKEMGVAADVQFSRNLILPVTANGEALNETKNVQNIAGNSVTVPNRVTGSFNMVVTDWNNIIAEIDLPPFVLAKHPEKFVFELNEAIFDFSDLNTPDVPFPDHYREQGLLLPNRETWRGVYVKSLQVGMPKTFKTTESIAAQKRVTFGATNLIIDNNGVSGIFTAENPISIDKGRTNEKKAWAYSVDNIEVKLVTNRITSAKFDGKIILPISDEGENANKEEMETSSLRYKGLISEDEYLMSVSNLDTLNFNVWKAKAQLDPNSIVELNVVDGNFEPKAILSGRMAISASQKESLENDGANKNGEEMVEFTGIVFQNLVLQTQSPVLKVDYLGYQDEVKLANFPVSISAIAFDSDEQGAGLRFDLKLNLMGKEDKGFAADAHLGVMGTFIEENFKQRWKYDRLDVSKIRIDANVGSIELTGDLELMSNDPIYGNGFTADIKGTFGKIGPINCKAIFGRSDFRYWYVDAAVRDLSIPIGAMEVTGFAGGAYYRMTRKPGGGPDYSPSGLAYLPSADTSIGAKAMIFAAVGKKGAIDLGVGFEMEFNNSLGLRRIGLYGEAQVMQAFDFPNPVAKMTEKLGTMVDNETLTTVMNSKTGEMLLNKADTEYEPEVVGEANLSAKIGIEYDFENKSFHAMMDLYVNVAGGVVKGRASQGRAGWGVIHIDPDTWYVHMGTPDDRLGLEIGVGGFALETGGYFMMGNEIPGSPPPPLKVAEILNKEQQQLDYMRDLNALGNGQGFAFGADFKMDTGEMNFLMFYARFQAGLGFDIMLKNYGLAECSNTGKQVGINGWYANGQAYAYLQGELGINVKLFFVEKRIPIITAAAAVLLQAQGPNPIWMRGIIGGEYDLLNGTITGNFNFEMEIGEKCALNTENPMGGLKIIADVTPTDGADEVDVFAAPQVAFNLGVEKAMVIPEADGDHTYKITLDEFKITDDQNNLISGKMKWDDNKTAVTFLPEDILSPSTPMKVTVTVGFKELVNGIYKVVIVNGTPAKETEERSFVTGGAPEYIPLHNITYAYPVVDQKYFYPKEYGTGYIQLRQGQDYLFDDAQWKSTVKISDANGNGDEANFTYNTGSNQLRYTLPKTKNETGYDFVIVSRPKNTSTTTAAVTETATTDLGDNNTVSVKTNKAGTVSQDGSIERINYSFKTSAYNTFAQKVGDMNVKEFGWNLIEGNRENVYLDDAIYLFNRIKNHEPFEIAELIGNQYTDNRPLIDAAADVMDDYFVNDLNPLLYSKYKTGTYKISRDPQPYGFIPKKALPIYGKYLTSTENNIDTDFIETIIPYRYNLPQIYRDDFNDVKTRLLSASVRNRLIINANHSAIMDTDFPFMREGYYSIDLQYTLPDGNLGSKSKVRYKNPLNYR